jgi:hypothetical protein
MGALHDFISLSAANVEIFSLIGKPSVIDSENGELSPVRSNSV